MTERQHTNHAVLDSHEPSWVAQGYRVIREPSGSYLPKFLKRFEPDAILLGRTPKIVVEVVRKGQPNVERKIRLLNETLSNHQDWRLEVLYAGSEPEQLPAVTTVRLKEQLADIRKLLPLEQRGSLLLLWATLEALSRRLQPDQTKHPLTPGSVVELLAGEGFVTPGEARQLREAVKWRNRLAHGDLEITPVGEKLYDLVAIAERLIVDLERQELVQSNH